MDHFPGGAPNYQVEELEWIPWRQLFDVDEENNIPTWFAGFLLAVTAFWVWVVADAKHGSSDRWWMHWKLLAGASSCCLSTRSRGSTKSSIR